jgi:replicative DNA helicase
MENFKNINPVKVDKSTIISLEKLQPQAIELEEVLGAMMIDKKGVDDVIDILQPDAFTKKRTNIFLKPSFNYLLIRNLSIY